MAFAGPAGAQPAIKKVINGKFLSGVDNGWVVFGDKSGTLAGTLSLYNSKAGKSYKLKTPNAGLQQGIFYVAEGIVFAPCPAAAPPNYCAASEVGSGVGLAFGVATFGGGGGNTGGWINDRGLTARYSDPAFAGPPPGFTGAPGAITGAAVDAANGAFAVGWDAFPSGFNRAMILRLNTATPTYRTETKIDLGTLGGNASQALAISKNALHVAGIAEDASGVEHAVYAGTSSTSWTNISAGWPAEIIKSRALAVSNTGFVTGSATVKRVVAGSERSVDIGFVYDTNTSTVEFFELLGTNVKPMRVLDDGRVVGNLEFVGPGTPKPNHPFVFDGDDVNDLGTMTLASTSLPAFGCRVNAANNLGELVGSCIPNAATPYGETGSAFYIDAAAATPAFIDVNAMIHSTSDAVVTAVKPYRMGSVTAIDDAHEITVMGRNKSGASAGFLAFKPSYNP